MQRLNELDLNLFVAFDALYRERSVTRAAESLGLTQPAMSHKLRRLRDALGDPLFVSSTQGLLPTSVAEAIAPGVQTALKSLTGARDQTGFDPATAERHFVLQMNDFAEITFLPKALHRIRETGPGLSIETVPPSPDIAGALERGQIDLGIGAGMSLPASARRMRFSSHDFVVVFRRDHPNFAEGMTLPAYLDADHIVVAPRGGASTFVDDALAALGHQRKIACRVRRFVTAPFIAADSDLVCTTPRAIYDSLRHRLPIGAFDVPFEIPNVLIYMYWHERAHHDPAHIWLRQLAIDLIEEDGEARVPQDR